LPRLRGHRHPPRRLAVHAHDVLPVPAMQPELLGAAMNEDPRLEMRESLVRLQTAVKAVRRFNMWEDVEESADGLFVHHDDYARLAARVGELERERDAARAELEEVLSILGLSGSDPDVCCCGSMISDRTCHTAGHSPRSMREYALTSMVEQASALAAKLAQHREALTPLVVIAAEHPYDHDDELIAAKYDDWGKSEYRLTLGDCRRARDVMEAGR
jgi:hypothetical protein